MVRQAVGTLLRVAMRISKQDAIDSPTFALTCKEPHMMKFKYSLFKYSCSRTTLQLAQVHTPPERWLALRRYKRQKAYSCRLRLELRSRFSCKRTRVRWSYYSSSIVNSKEWAASTSTWRPSSTKSRTNLLLGFKTTALRLEVK